MQLKCLKQELLNMKSCQRTAHEGIISMALAVNRTKHIAANLKVGHRLKVNDELAEKLALKLPHSYSEKLH